MQASNRKTPILRFSTFGLRRLALTSLVALAAGIAQPVLASPHGGGHHGRGGMGMDGMMMANPRHMDRMFDSIGATADQRSQIKAIVDATRTDLRAQRSAGRSLRDQAQAIFLQPNVDANQVEALRQQMLTQHDAASKRMMQAMIDISRVLTPEQRQKIAEKIAQRRSMMERHRAERAAAGAPTR